MANVVTGWPAVGSVSSAWAGFGLRLSGKPGRGADSDQPFHRAIRSFRYRSVPGWGTPAAVEARVGEIPSPFDSLASRTTWLQSVLRSTWSEQPDDLGRWKSDLLSSLRGLSADTIVVSHFVAINAIVGVATGDDRVVSFMPDHCSQTVIDVDGDDFVLVELGAQATTRIR